MKPIRIGDVVGDYRVIDTAGSGGMGAVYKIEHVITRRVEAMKRLPPDSGNDPEKVRRFEREIQVQARLHHPNIVALYNAVRDGDSIALVMEFVEGESLQRKLEAGPLPVQTAVDFAGQILRALAYAHDAGVIHRDVAPANIIITPQGVVKLMDFGLARVDHEDTTDLRISTSGVPIGSPWYMSPEQVKAIGPMDARTDIYATGAVLHEMLTGAKLFEAEGAFAVMRAHVEATPAPPSSRNPEVPAALDQIVRKAVEKDPAMRFQSADEFRLALETAVAFVPAMVAPSRPRLYGLRPSRAAVMVALLPIALAAGILRLVPVSAHVHAPAVMPAAIVAGPDTSHEAAPVVQVEPQTPPDVTAKKEEKRPATATRNRSQIPAQATRRSSNPQSYAIRVTGGDPQPADPVPAAVPTARESPEPLEPLATESETLPEALPAAANSAPNSAATTQEAAPAKPPGLGNRFVRALGRVNPFHRGAKHDTDAAAKTQLKKD